MERRDEIILEICALVAKEAQLREIVKHRTKVAAVVGGNFKLFTGSTSNAAATPRPRPVDDIIRNELTDQQKVVLVQTVRRFFDGIHLFDAVDGLAQLTKTLDLRLPVKQAIIAYLKRSMNLHVWSSKSMW